MRTADYRLVSLEHSHLPAVQPKHTVQAALLPRGHDMTCVSVRWAHQMNCVLCVLKSFHTIAHKAKSLIFLVSQSQFETVFKQRCPHVVASTASIQLFVRPRNNHQSQILAPYSHIELSSSGNYLISLLLDTRKGETNLVTSKYAAIEFLNFRSIYY